MKALVILLGAVSIFVQSAVAAPAPHERQSDPSRLWHAFPLEPAPAKQSALKQSHTPPPAPDSQLAAANAEPDRYLLGALSIVALAGGATVALLVFFASRPPGDRRFRLIITSTKGVPVSSFIRRRSDERSEGKTPDTTAVEAPVRIGDSVTSYTMHQPDAESGPPDESGTPDEAVEPDSAASSAVSYDEFGQRIANVLRSAEENSAQLLGAARAEAEAIRETAELEAREARTQLDAETAERRSESERVRAEANRYAEERRRTAELEAQQTQAEAETEARSLRETGEGIRRRLEEKGLARRQELLEASSSIESQLREALTTCRDVAAEIERLLGDDEPELVEDLLAEVGEPEHPLPVELFGEPTVSG